MSERLQNKVAVVTGGTRGFGLAVAQAYVQAGASAVVASRSQASVDRALETLDADSGRASGLTCDVTDLAQVRALKAHALDTFGHLDIWVNNAGIAGPYGPTAHIAPAAFRAVLDTNILGTYHGAWVAMQHFLPQGRGKLINILGFGDRRPGPMQNAYASSKTWIRTFTLALAKEYADSGVGVYAYNPGMMTTDLLMQVDVVEGYEHRLDVFPTIIRMLAKPPEVPAQTMVKLASAATDGRTGLVLRAGSPLTMLGAALREGTRRLLRRPAPSVEIDIRTLPKALD